MTDDNMKRSELGSGQEEDATDGAGASTATSIRHVPIKSELRRKD